MIVLRVGEKVYVPPGSIEWAASLRPAAEWLEKDLNRIAGARVPTPELSPSDLPAHDGVDVLAQGEDPNAGADDENLASP
jgi:hypothetical protein